MNYVETLRKLLVCEYNKTEQEAIDLTNKHSKIVMNGIMSGLTMMSIRACAMAIDMAENEK